ncbi:hypothetical protein K458DRAFT_272825, partial [Lentithecium fluviatile CBS 122367]
KGKKSPRHSGDDHSLEESPRAKKPRIMSLFGGGPGSHSDEEADEEDMQPKTPGQGIGMRMSSLTLEQQDEIITDHQDQAADNGEETSPTFSEHSSKLDDDEYPLPAENPALSYGLRRNIDRTVATTTWLDVDQSGNYDPEEEDKKKALKLNKAKAKKKGKQKAAPKERKMKKIVKLRIQAIGNVLNITNGEDHWSDGHSMIDPEEEREMQELRSFYRQRTPGVEPQEPISDPKGELADLTGHPVARGCKTCRKYDQGCSMTANGEYPCAQCVEDGTECQAIVTPMSHGYGRCNLCEQRRQPCSFEDGSMCSICDQCLDSDDLECVPGKLANWTSDRIDLDRILYGPDRKHEKCTYCRTHKKRCSLKAKEDKPPCKYCKKHTIGCTFYDTMPVDLLKKGKGKQKAGDKTKAQSSRKKTDRGLPEVSIPDSSFFDANDLEDMNREDEEDNEREETPEIEMEDTEGRVGMMIKIKTSFAHPIEFYIMDGDAPDCNFCEMPVFGFVGHFEKTVYVIRWHNGLGFTELAAGHREDHGATTMCQNCTFTRLQIIACPGHGMQRIDDPSVAQVFEAAAEELMLAEPRSQMMQYQLQRWCSMCFDLATFMCCTPQPSVTESGFEEEDSLIDGCGLRLCNRCEQELRELFEGSSHSMTAAYEQEPKPQVDQDGAGSEQATIRADVGFLKVDGLLMRNVE